MTTPATTNPYSDLPIPVGAVKTWWEYWAEDFRPCSRAQTEAHSDVMEHLTALDASFLEAEDSDPHVSLAIAGVS